MTKKFIRFIALVCSLICILSTATACGPRGTTIKIDKTKTQLYIGNFDGGMGSRWLKEYKIGFEALYAEIPFEEGKKGVEVIDLSDKIAYDAAQIEKTIDGSSINLFFTEQLDYYKFVEKGLLYDITDIVTADIPGEELSIEDKLNESQVSYYKYNGRYYGIPHYRSYRGIVYDKDLFDLEYLYITENGDIDGKSTDTNLSKGPDGVKGTYDDGLPATYEEFFYWCNYVNQYKGVTPICWTGQYKETYTQSLLDALFADAQGLEGANAYYNLPLDASQAKQVKMVTGFTEDGPNIETKPLSRDNYADRVKVAGKYYSFDFLQKIIAGNYYQSLSTNSTQSHELTHYDFLHSRFDPGKRPIAMMVEGTWWEEEADGIFKSMVNSGYEGAARTERNFGFLPLPKPTEEYLGGQTLFDANQSIAIVNANCSDLRADLAFKFIQYISTDANLQLFNTMTGIGRDYNYSLTTTQEEGLSTFAKDIYSLTKQGTGIVYGFQTTYNNYKWSQVNFASNHYASKIGNNAYTSPIEGFLDNKTAQQYFLGMQG